MKQRFGMDAFRYFLLREMAFGQDATFSEDAFVTRVNADLANNLGNLVSRTLAMQQRYFAGVVQPLGERTAEDRDAGRRLRRRAPRRCRRSSSSSPSIARSKRCGARSTRPTSTSSRRRRSRWPRIRPPSRASARSCTTCSRRCSSPRCCCGRSCRRASARILAMLDRPAGRDAVATTGVGHGARRRTRDAQAGDPVPAHRDMIVECGGLPPPWGGGARRETVTDPAHRTAAATTALRRYDAHRSHRCPICRRCRRADADRLALSSRHGGLRRRPRRRCWRARRAAGVVGRWSPSAPAGRCEANQRAVALAARARADLRHRRRPPARSGDRRRRRRRRRSTRWPRGPKVVAIGETGLDYHYDNSPRPRQRDAFARFIELARAARLADRRPPARRRRRRASTILRAEGARDAGGVIHCFSGDARQRARLPRPRLPHLVQRHRHLQDRRRAARGGAHRPGRPPDGRDRRAVPRARRRYRGRRNEPALVVHTAAVLAEVRGEPLAQVRREHAAQYASGCSACRREA